MNEVLTILSNPLILQGLKIASPSVCLGVDVALAIINNKTKPSVAALLSVIDKQLALILKELSSVKSAYRKQELEIRAHTLLNILHEWDKIND